MADTGLHSLVDAPCEEELVLNKLTKQLTLLLGNDDCHMYSGNNFLDSTNQFLQRVRTKYSHTKGCHTTTILIPCLRSLLVVVAETVFVSCSSHICKKAVDDVMVLPSIVKLQLIELLTKLTDIQREVLSLQKGMCQVLDVTNSQDFPHDSSLIVLRQSQHALDMLEGCQALLAVVVEGVEKKAEFEVRFFNTASVTVGMFSAGRLAWSLWRGETFDEVVSAGVWSVCVGFSAAVLQIPRIRVTDITTKLRQQREHRKQIKILAQGWGNVADWSYAKFVRLPSPRNAVSL